MTTWEIFRRILVGKRYGTITDIREQARYLTMNFIFAVALAPLMVLAIPQIGDNMFRAVMDFCIAGLCLAAIILIRSKLPLFVIPIGPVVIFGVYCCYLLYDGGLTLWVAVWLFAFPPIAIFLCQMTIGVILSGLALVTSILLLFTPFSHQSFAAEIRIRFVAAYVLILMLTIIYEWIGILKDRKENQLKAELARERDVVQGMKDNIPQGIFMMDRNLAILPQYSKPLVSILSYYDSDLAGKSFLDILAASLSAKQLQTMKGYFSMIFDKAKSAKVLEAANPLSEFEYKIGDRAKFLSTRFSLVEQAGSEPTIIGIIEDISREKEFAEELEAQQEARDVEMKNLFDVIQIDPLVFNDFVDDTEAGFNHINDVLKDRGLTEKQVVLKFFQSVHAIKANAQILGLATFAEKLHSLEDRIQAVSALEEIRPDDILSLALNLETIMQEKDNYLKTVRKIESFKSSNQIDSVLVHSLARAVEKTAAETNKQVDIKAGALDRGILESALRRPIKEILLQCIRNSIYHGIEPQDERARKRKNPRGLLVFSIKRGSDGAEVTFSDDGRGLDWEKIKRKYLEKNRAKKPGPGGAEPDRRTLLASIFQPEFSTADDTTAVAGRGVGLSLVRELVKENRGLIKVDSTESGLTFRFIFPLAG